jgi:hypothetical protein
MPAGDFDTMLKNSVEKSARMTANSTVPTATVPGHSGVVLELWLNFLYDDVRLESAAEFELLEPWMLQEGLAGVRLRAAAALSAGSILAAWGGNHPMKANTPSQTGLLLAVAGAERWIPELRTEAEKSGGVMALETMAFATRALSPAGCARLLRCLRVMRDDEAESVPQREL